MHISARNPKKGKTQFCQNCVFDNTVLISNSPKIIKFKRKKSTLINHKNIDTFHVFRCFISLDFSIL